MATQRLTVVTLGGRAVEAVTALFATWQVTPDPSAIDHFCRSLRENAASLPILYFSEWIDRWLMGDTVVREKGAQGRIYQVTCLSQEEARAWADGCVRQFVEQEWLAARLR